MFGKRFGYKLAIIFVHALVRGKLDQIFDATATIAARGLRMLHYHYIKYYYDKQDDKQDAIEDVDIKFDNDTLLALVAVELVVADGERAQGQDGKGDERTERPEGKGGKGDERTERPNGKGDEALDEVFVFRMLFAVSARICFAHDFVFVCVSRLEGWIMV